MRTVLITRPADQSADTAERLRALGFHPVFAPALRIEALSFDASRIGSGCPIIFSSANAVRSVAASPSAGDLADRTVFAVGDATARTARDHGFTRVISAGGTMADLTQAIRVKMKAPGGLLYFRGENISADPAEELTAGQGWHIDGIVTYRATPVARIDPLVVHSLQSGGVEAVLLYSRRSADAFVTALRADWPDAALTGTKALCLSDAVVESACNIPWSAILVSRTPDQAGMLDLLDLLKR